MKAVVVVAICGSGNSWKVAGPSDPPKHVQTREVSLEIRGNATVGYHLVMTPSGCFTADYWYESVADAQDSAEEIFGITRNGWS